MEELTRMEMMYIFRTICGYVTCTKYSPCHFHGVCGANYDNGHPSIKSTVACLFQLIKGQYDTISFDDKEIVTKISLLLDSFGYKQAVE